MNTRPIQLRLETPVFPVVEVHRGLDQARTTAATSMLQYGVAVIRDHRVSSGMRSRGISMMQRYFLQPREVLERDVRRDPGKVIGVKLAGTELSRDWQKLMGEIPEDHRPWSYYAPRIRNPHDRYHWRAILPDSFQAMEPPERELLLADQVLPWAPNFHEWAEVMNDLSENLLAAVFDFARLLSVGLGLREEDLVEGMIGGTNLLAPTGANLLNFPNVGDVQASWHRDFGRFTIHLQASHPGLICWTRDLHPFLVRVPEGCLLVQAGMELEHLTGGAIPAGFHEIVTLPQTLEAIRNATTPEHRVRVAFPLFAQGGPEDLLIPKGRFLTSESVQQYPATLAGVHQGREIAAIGID